MKNTKIDWCDCTINPVVGCPRGCEYCYACKQNARFKWVEDFSKPKFFTERLEQLSSKKPKSIFINSMSDIAYWKKEWADTVYEAIAANPQHEYITLTKGFVEDEGVKNMWRALSNAFSGIRVWHGITATTQARIHEIKDHIWKFSFLNIEPILELIDISELHSAFSKGQGIIIGAETGNRKGKVIPKKEWIEEIVKQADNRGLSVFMKGSLRQIMGADFRQDPLMWQ